MELEIGKVGVKGQIVIPQEMRKDLKIHSGEKVLFVEGHNEIILKPLNKFKAETLSELQEEIIDMKLADKAMEDIRKGKGTTKNADEFLRDMKKWVSK